MRQRKFQAAENFQNRGKLNGDLQRTADNRGPCGDDDKRALRAASAEGEHSGDHGDVPEDRGGVREEKFAVTVENAETPRGGNEQACSRK